MKIKKINPANFHTIAIIVLLVAMIRQGEHKHRNHPNQDHKIIAQNMNTYRNRKANPCEDFYEYACGNWLSQQEILLTTSGDLVSVQKQVELKVRQQLQYAFEEPVTMLEALDFRNLKNFFRSCKTTKNNSPIQRKFLHDFLRKNGGVPFLSTTGWQEPYQWLQIIAHLRRFYNLNILISIDIEKNPTNMRSNIVLNEPKTTLLPMELCSSIALNRDYDHTEAYNNLQNEVRDNLKMWFELKDSVAVRLAGDITNFQFDLCKYMSSQHTILEIGPSYARYMENRQRLTSNRIHGVQQQYNTNPPKTLFYLNKEFNINFKEYVDICLDTNFNAQVQLRSESYFRHLNRLSQSQPMQSFANYIMYVALNSISFPSKELPGSRPLYCVDKCLEFFPDVVGHLYNQNFQHSDIKEDVEAIHLNIKNAFLKNIEVEWINQNTKRIMKQKLAQIQLTFPIYEDPIVTATTTIMFDIQNLDYWHKLEVLMSYKSNQTLQKHQTPASSNIVESIAVDLNLNLPSNEIQIGWGLLQPPLYSINYPTALKYAFLGHRLARELFKVFEWAWDSNYSMGQHWDSTAAADFHDRTNCFQNQMSNYLYNRPVEFRNISKLRELIADNTGLNNAFAAYINWLETISSTNYEILHGETVNDLNLTNTQLFFLHFAQSRCAAKWLIKPQDSYDYFPLDRHTFERYEINGPLSNSIEFSRDFHCRIGSNMHSNDKCLIY